MEEELHHTLGPGAQAKEDLLTGFGTKAQWPALGEGLSQEMPWPRTRPGNEGAPSVTADWIHRSLTRTSEPKAMAKN